MRKFKVGDKVRLSNVKKKALQNLCCNGIIGDVYKIHRYVEDSSLPIMLMGENGVLYNWHKEEWFEFVIKKCIIGGEIYEGNI